MRAIEKNMEQIAHYPDPDCTELRQLLAVETGLAKENIILGNGAVELIFILMHVLKSRKVLLPAPTFGEYAVAVKAAGGSVVSLPLKREENFALNRENIIAALDAVDAVIICNPNNPTGQMITACDLMKIIREAQIKGKWVIVDEAFMDFVRHREHFTVVNLVNEYPNLFVLYSLTKFYAIPGLRLGAGFADEKLVKKMFAGKDPWNVNVLAQIAGIASLKDWEYRENTIRLIEKEKAFLFKRLNEVRGLHAFEPSVNYIFLDVQETGRTSFQLTEEMGKKGILIRDCSTYENLGLGYIRVAVRSRVENLRLLRTLKEVIEE